MATGNPLHPAQSQAPAESPLRGLYATHAPTLKAYFLRRGFPHACAEALALETFDRTVRALTTPDATTAALPTALAETARRLAREISPEPDQAFDPDLADQTLPTPGQPAPRPPPEELDPLSQCIDALPADLARVIHLRYVQARTTAGIAAAAALPEPDAAARLREALRLLRQCLQAKGILQ